MEREIEEAVRIENVNTGICHRRVQEGKPSFFVNWNEDGENKYEFFQIRFVCEDLKNRLVERQKEEDFKQQKI